MEKISIKKFVELLYAQLAKQGRYDITVDEIGNAILILKKAPMFSIYKNILIEKCFTIADLKEVLYTRSVNGFGVVEFDILPEVAEKIISENVELSEMCEILIDYIDACKYINMKSKGEAYCNINDPNDSYETSYSYDGKDKNEKIIFTDGDVVLESLSYDADEPLTKVRNLVIRDATFSFCITRANDDIKSIEVRNYDFSDSVMHIMGEIENFFNGRVSHYKELSSNPKVYKLYKN